MGQCSTLPADTRPSASTTTSNNSAGVRNDHGMFSQTTASQLREDKKKRLSDGGRRESLDFNAIVPPDPSPNNMQNQKKEKDPTFSTDFPMKNIEEPQQIEEAARPQTRDPETPPLEEDGVEEMEIDPRDQAPANIPPPPEGAIRTRCYRLNLESDFVGLSTTQKQALCLGPFSEPPPYLTYSSSEDSSQDVNPTKVAIKTAQIFRGITISRDGTILSQNARATRSSRGNKNKRGEKSRQAAKIDKAKDLVDEVFVPRNKDTEEMPNMVSLVIIGEYDDMKQLVRDGSKKLREASGLPDEALLSINRPRANSASPIKTKPKPPSSASTSRKRNSVSPNFVNSQRTAAMQAPEPVQVAVTTAAQTVTPPKLKSHPRDNRPTRREERANMRMRLESCSDFMDPRHTGASGNGDWSHAWNIWNCVGSGAVSPLQPSSPNDNAVVFEGRETSFGVREGGITGRAN